MSTKSEGALRSMICGTIEYPHPDSPCKETVLIISTLLRACEALEAAIYLVLYVPMLNCLHGHGTIRCSFLCIYSLLYV